MIETTLIINKPFALKQINGRPIYTEIIKPEERIKEMEEKGVDKKYYNGWYSEYKKFLKNNVREIKVNHEIDLGKLESIIITPNAKGYISTYFLDFIQKFSIPIYWITGEGMIESCFMPQYYKKSSLVVKQCEARLNGKNLKIAKYLIGLKFKSQGMEHVISNLKKAKTIEEIIKIEGAVSKKYYSSWSFDDKWRWESRRGRSILNVNAIDPINSMLNFGYALLAQRMSEILLKRGYELSIGFMHMNEKAHRRYWNMLTYDFIEPYRIWIDNRVKEMVEDNKIKPTDFTYTVDKIQMVLKNKAFDVGINNFIEVLKPLEYQSLPIIRTVESIL